MTTTLITGKGGTPHITSGDMGAMQAGIIGNGSYLLQGADGKFPAVTMQDANHALIPVLNLVVEGRYARVTEAETATIESGVSGRNRRHRRTQRHAKHRNGRRSDRPVGQHPLGLRHGVDPDRPHPDQRDHARHAGHAHQTAASHVEAVGFRNPAVEAAVYERQPHSVSGRTHRHDQRQRQVH